ncbi:MAG TPA: ABC transporter permease [Opitutus sp.]|nr:ABC transporter permease [Opitutus sp.]
MTSAFQKLFRSPVAWPLAGLLLLVFIDAIVHPGFLRLTFQDGHLFGVPIDILNQGARPLVLAAGMTLVIATFGVDLSVGSVMAVSGSIAAVLISGGTESLPVILAASLSAGVLAGLINGILVGYVGIQPIVATLILMVAGRGVAQLLTNGEVIIVKHAGFEFLGNGYLLALPFAAVLAVLLFLATHFALRRTAAGLFIEAVGDNPIASRFAGLATARIKCAVYVFSGFCAALAGVMAAANVRAADPYRVGENMELDAIFAVVVGGTALSGGRFLLLGSFIGALLLQTLTQTMYYAGVPPAVAPVPKALLILAVCLLQSDRTRGWLKGLVPQRTPK